MVVKALKRPFPSAVCLRGVAASQPESRVKLQLAFGQNPGKYFPAVFFWAYEDVISQWIPICQNVPVHSGTDSVYVGLGFWNELLICWLFAVGLFIGLVWCPLHPSPQEVSISVYHSGL